jgi:ribosomal protein S9
MLKRLQIVAKVHGGGYMGQAGAIRLAIANALRYYDPNHEGVLRDATVNLRWITKID